MNTAKLSKEIKRLTAIKNERIVKALNVRADLIVAEGTQSRPLFCVSYVDGKEYVTHGATVIFTPNGETDQSGKAIPDQTVVRMEDYGTPHIYSRYDSVEALSKYLDERNILHVIRFFDEDGDDAKPDA